MSLPALHPAWEFASRQIASIPQQFIDAYRGDLTELISIHVDEFKARISLQSPRRDDLYEFLDGTKLLCDMGDVRKALERQAVGLIEELPAKGKDGWLKQEFAMLFGHENKTDIIVSNELNMSAINALIPASLRLISDLGSGLKPDARTYFQRYFPLIDHAPKYP